MWGYPLKVDSEKKVHVTMNLTLKIGGFFYAIKLTQ